MRSAKKERKKAERKEEKRGRGTKEGRIRMEGIK